MGKQLALMQKEIESKYNVSLQKDTYDECFTRIKSGDGSKLVVIIDEFTKITRKDTDFLKSINNLKNKKLYVY